MYRASKLYFPNGKTSDTKVKIKIESKNKSFNKSRNKRKIETGKR